MSDKCSIVGCNNKCVKDGIVCKGCLNTIDDDVSQGGMIQ